jgi:hypothetical protein
MESTKSSQDITASSGKTKGESKPKTADWYRRRDFKLARIAQARNFFNVRFKCLACGYVSHHPDEIHRCVDGKDVIARVVKPEEAKQ